MSADADAARQVSVACPAKVNVFLRILAREDSGYHQIETFFLAVGIFDRVTVAPGGPGIVLDARAGKGDASLEDLGPAECNTVVRAAHAFFKAIGRASPAATIRLDKAIPSGSGLGGGSSDAAGALAALNAAHGTPLADAELLELGGRIGADVPFFCARSPAALAWGRGDRLLPCPLPPPALVVVASPRQRLRTSDAYREVSATLPLPPAAAALPGPAPSTWSRLASLAHNDFEAAAVRRMPLLARVRATLLESGAVLAGLTGSGSAIFGVFPRDGAAERRAEAAARALAAMDGDEIDVRIAPTLDRWPRLSEEAPAKAAARYRS